MNYSLPLLCIVCVSALSGCFPTAEQKNTTPYTWTTPPLTTTIATILPTVAGEKTAVIPSDPVGTAVWIWSKQLLTTAHTLIDTGQTYLLRDQQWNVCDIIKRQFHPTLDLVRFEVYGTCRGNALPIQLHKKNNTSVQIPRQDTVDTCRITTTGESIVTTDCTFLRWMSGSPVGNQQWHLVWLVQGTEEHTGYLLLFSSATIDWITRD
jgi:hypothetical protein